MLTRAGGGPRRAQAGEEGGELGVVEGEDAALPAQHLRGASVGIADREDVEVEVRRGHGEAGEGGAQRGDVAAGRAELGLEGSGGGAEGGR